MRALTFFAGAAFLVGTSAERFALTRFRGATFRATFFAAVLRATAFFAAFLGADFFVVDFFVIDFFTAAFFATFFAVVLFEADLRVVVFFATEVLSPFAMLVREALAAFLRAADFVVPSRRAFFRGVAMCVGCFTIHHQHGADHFQRKIRTRRYRSGHGLPHPSGAPFPRSRSACDMHDTQNRKVTGLDEVESGWHAGEADPQAFALPLRVRTDVR